MQLHSRSSTFRVATTSRQHHHLHHVTSYPFKMNAQGQLEVGEPIVDLQEINDHTATAATASPPGELEDNLAVAACMTTDDPLAVEVGDSLCELLAEYESTISTALEMKHVLRLLVTKFHNLSKDGDYHKAAWLAGINDTVIFDGDVESIRELTGEVVHTKFSAAPWGLAVEEGSQRSDAEHTIRAVYSGIVRFLRQLEPGLGRLEQAGVMLQEWDVDEMQSEDEDDEEDHLNADQSAPSAALSAPPTKKPAARKPRGKKAVASSAVPGKGKGNFGHGLGEKWTIPENLHMLKLVRDNPGKTNANIADLHNATFWANSTKNVTRTMEAVRQARVKHLGAGGEDAWKQNLLPKIAEFEGMVGNNN